MTSHRSAPGPDLDLEVDDVRDHHGRRIDEAYVERVVESARRVGRPPLGAGGRAPQVSFRLPAETRDRAVEVAARQGKTVSQLAREALERYLAAS